MRVYYRSVMPYPQSLQQKKYVKNEKEGEEREVDIN